MNVNVVPISALSEKDKEIWEIIQSEDPRYYSPYFCPGFYIALGKVRRDVFVSIIYEKDEIIGFFPFQKKGFRSSVPAGGKLSDIHGVIIKNSVSLDIIELLRLSKLNSYEFYHIPYWQDSFLGYFQNEETFYTIEVKEGFEQYTEELNSRKSKTLKDSSYKLRKLKRDYGNVEFKHFVEKKEVLNTLFEWKSKQYNKSKLVDVFAFKWATKFIEEIHSIRTESFSGILSMLCVDNDPIAIHFGMMSKWTWNWWFPRHDEKFKKYSPGILLRMNAIEYASEIGLLNVDLGCGEIDSYKPHLGTSSIKMGAGIVERPSVVKIMKSVFWKAVSIIKGSFLYHVFKVPGRAFFRVMRRGKFK